LKAFSLWIFFTFYSNLIRFIKEKKRKKRKQTREINLRELFRVFSPYFAGRLAMAEFFGLFTIVVTLAPGCSDSDTVSALGPPH
jgi:hypothetical protein